MGRFDWDDQNIAHLARHRITPEEVEELFARDPIIRDHEFSDGEDRWRVLGSTQSLRVLLVVFTMRNHSVRPITGWDADKKTKAEYFEESQ